MADLRYSVDVNTAQAERNLAQLQKTVGGVNSAFSGLKAALAGISLGAIIGSSIRMAAAMNDLSGNTNIAISSILGLSRAIVDNGGSADIAQKGIQKFAQSIGAAVEGGTELQRAFSGVGVTMEDLATLSETDLLAKTVAGLGRVEDSTKRIRLQAQLFGKEFGQVNMAGAASGFAASVAASARYEAAIRSAGAAQDKINKTIQDFQIVILKTIKPLIDFVESIDIEKIEAFVITIKNVVVALAAMFIVTKVASGVRALVDVFRTFRLGTLGVTAASSNLAIGLKYLKQTFDLSGAITVKTYTGYGILGQTLKSLAGAALRLGPIIATLYAAFQVLNFIVVAITDKDIASWLDKIGINSRNAAIGVEKLGDSLGNLLNLPTDLIGKILGVDNAVGLGTPLKMLAEQARKAREEAEKAVGAGGGRGDGQAELEQRRKDADEKKRLREITDALAKRRAEISKASQAFKDQNSQILANIGLEKTFIGQSEDFIELERAREEVFGRATAETEKLREAKKLLTKDESALAAVYDQQIAKIHAAAQVDAARIAGSITNLQGLRLVEQGRLQDIENTTRAIEDQMARQEQLAGILRSASDQRVELRFGQSQQGRSGLARQVAEIQETARKAALEAGRAFSESFPEELSTQVRELNDGTKEYYGTAVELAKGLDQIANAYKGIADEQLKSLGLSKEYLDGSLTDYQMWVEEFKVGTKDAFTKFKDDAMDAGKQAANSFTNFTSRMEDAFVEFARTGKLSFKSLADSIIADLIRIAVRKAIVAAIGGPLGSLFGFANGGPVMGATPIIVGERGPELFVPQSAGKIISNSALKGSGQNSSSMGGGQTVVNYNIQAVDASSFRSLVAKDPSFIYAVTEQGRRSQPTRSR